MRQKKTLPGQTNKTAKNKKEKSAGKLSFDRRLFEKAYAGQFNKNSLTPLDRAQDLTYKAWETNDSKKRISLANQALKICPDCAEAYNLLAEEASKTIQECSALYLKGAMAGERALGKMFLEENTGHFWGLFETRPYMRAKAGLAQGQWALGAYSEAVGHYKDILRLNPNDNQGIRYLLMPCLIELGNDDEAERLWKKYGPESCAFWVYSRALLDYRKSGDTAVANKALNTAVQRNPHVPGYLLGLKKLPKLIPDMYSLHSEEEAIIYTDNNLTAWKSSPGALKWLAKPTR